MRKAIVLLSGGIDSATALYIAKNRKFQPSALIFDYGQRHGKEIEFAKRLAKRARCPHRVIKLRFPWKGSSLLDRKVSLPTLRSLKEIKKSVPSTYVPGRNLIFLAYAVSFAESVKAGAVFIGAHSEDYSGYPDCRRDFFEALRETIAKGTRSGRNIKICAPLLGMGKKEIIKKGFKLEIPYELTWSCYKGESVPCGICDSCYFRKKAFGELGIGDPYYAHS